jgi:uroporphyrinogen-III synthase
MAEPGTALPLTGYTVGVTAARKREELGAALERQGARVMYGPAIRLVPLADDTVLREATAQCIAAPLDVVVVTTGVGFRGWTEAAATWEVADALTARLSAATILTRGPKARGAVRAAGLREAWSPESESSAGVLEHLLEHDDLAGKRIAVQLHGEPLDDVVDALRTAGAHVIPVPVYRWVPPEDEYPLHQLLEATANGAVDAMTFTSAPAAVNFLRTAAERGIGDDVVAALSGPVLCVAVGPVTAAPLERAGIRPAQPERARMGALVRTVVELLPHRDVTGGTARLSAER